MKLWIQNGRVIDPESGLCHIGDVVIENGKKGDLI